MISLWLWFFWSYSDLVSSSFHDFELPDEVIHLEHLEPNVLVAELFRGPTLAFKDLSLNILAKLLEFFLKKEVNSIPIITFFSKLGNTMLKNSKIWLYKTKPFVFLSNSFSSYYYF